MRRPAYFTWLAIAIALLPAASQAQGRRTTTKKAAGCGPLAEQAFSCPKYDFTYKVPFGWVDRTDDMQESTIAHSQTPSESHAARNAETKTADKSHTLLAVFSRPPGAPGKTVDSAVIIAAESMTEYPAIKTAADYFGPITDLAEQRGFKAEGEPYEFRLGTRRLVRGDFSQQAGSVTMWQSTLVIIEKAEILSFTFLADSEDTVNELIANLAFQPARPGGQNPHS
jgi:hypothetical protein